MKISNNEIQKAIKIKNAVQDYLEQTKKVNLRSTDVFPFLVRRGIFEQDYRNGLYFRKFLKKLFKADMLHSLIPQCKYVPGINGEIYGEWYFNSSRPKAKEKQEKTTESSGSVNLYEDLSYEDAKENLWQLIQGINPLSGEKLKEIEEPSLTLIRISLKVFIEADIESEIVKNEEETEKISRKEAKMSSTPESKKNIGVEPPPANYIEKIRVKYPKAYYPWNKEEELLLIKLYEENQRVGNIAKKLQRQPGAIKARLKKIGLLD